MTTNSQNDTYTSPLASRNASPEMLRIWSPRHKFNTWRRIWLAVAEAQHEVTKGWETPLVTQEQLGELRTVVERGITDEEIARAGELERDLRHDVMAHVHCLGEQCPKAKGIIHLGCTSQDVVCNADLLILCESIRLVLCKAVRATSSMATEAMSTRTIPALGFTHYQVAQPVTVGRRTAGWASDLALALRRLEVYDDYFRDGGDLLENSDKQLMLLSRGIRGATGTQASYLNLLGESGDRVDRLNASVVQRMWQWPRPGFKTEGEVARYDRDYGAWLSSQYLTGQTYPRVVDTFILADLASIAAVLHKIATDIRLLSNRKEIDEPFGAKQIGSSAMPYKRNPMKCERICGLTRFVMNLVGNAYDTAATQWLERTLDDSSNRRLSLPEAFLALDGALDLMHQVASGLVVHEAMVRKNLLAELPFLATENIMMEAVKLGGDRQELHEKIRVHAQAAGMKVKQEGLDNDLIERLRQDDAFKPVHHLLTEDQLLDPMKYVGRSVEQTERFLKEVVEPLRERYGDELEKLGGSDRGV